MDLKIRKFCRVLTAKRRTSVSSGCGAYTISYASICWSNDTTATAKRGICTVERIAFDAAARHRANNLPPIVFTAAPGDLVDGRIDDRQDLLAEVRE